MPLLWISLCFIIGLIAGEYLPWTATGWLSLAGAVCVLWPILRLLPTRRAILRWLRGTARVVPSLRLPPLLLLAFALLGAARISTSGPDLSGGHVAAINDQGKYRIQGIVAAPPDWRDRYTLLRIQVEQITPLDDSGAVSAPTRLAHGSLMALLPGRADWQYGDCLGLEGSPIIPPESEDFSYRGYLARQDIYTYLTYPRIRLVSHNAGSPILATIYRARAWAYAEIFQLYPAPESALLSGILIGIDNDLPESLVRAYQDTGTAHVIAISGFNIAILAGLFSSLFGRIFSRWWALVASVLAISVYTLMVGATPSVVRAAIMGSLSLLAAQLGRRNAGLNALLLSAGIMCLFNPHLPWDVSFQLSFGATAGLILYGDRFQSSFSSLLQRHLPAGIATRIAGPVGEYFLLTLAAQLMTLPIILYHFQRLSLSALLANPLILPSQPAVMVVSGISVLAGAISHLLAQFLAWLAWPLAAYTNRMVELLAGIPGGVVVLDKLSLGAVVLMYAAILAPVVSPRLPGAWAKGVKSAMLLAGAGLLAAFLIRAAIAAPDGRLHLVIANLQGSPAILVRAPAGGTMLVNGGPSARQLNNLLGRWLSPLDRHLDGLLINDSRASTINGLAPVLERYPPELALWGCAPPDTHTAFDLGEALHTQNADTHILAAGETLQLGDQVRIDVLAANSQGSALLITSGSFRALIPGGINPAKLPPEYVNQVGLIILEKRDLQTTDSATWLGYAPQAVIYITDDYFLAPEGVNWFNALPQDWYQATTDGEQMWMEARPGTLHR